MLSDTGELKMEFNYNQVVASRDVISFCYCHNRWDGGLRMCCSIINESVAHPWLFNGYIWLTVNSF